MSPERPINITSLCKLSSSISNKVVVSWAVEVECAQSVSVALVEQPTHQRTRNENTKAEWQDMINEVDADGNTTENTDTASSSTRATELFKDTEHKATEWPAQQQEQACIDPPHEGHEDPDEDNERHNVHVCSLCEEEAKQEHAVCYCQECGVHLCSTCREAHSWTRRTRGHIVREFGAATFQPPRRNATEGREERETLPVPNISMTHPSINRGLVLKVNRLAT